MLEDSKAHLQDPDFCGYWALPRFRQALEQMQADMRRQMADLTVQLTNKLVGESLTDKKQRDLVGQFLTEMGD